MKKIFVVLSAVAILACVPQQSDAQFLKKLGKIAGKVGNVVSQAAGVAGTFTGSNATNILSKVGAAASQVGNAAGSLVGENGDEQQQYQNDSQQYQNDAQQQYYDPNAQQYYSEDSYAQQSSIRVVTGHPDFDIQVTRCVASGDAVILDMNFVNNSSEDIDDVEIYSDDDTEVIDDQGKKYDSGNITVRFVGNGGYAAKATDGSILSGVPLKVSMRINGVSANAQSLARVLLSSKIDQWGLGSGSKPIQLRGVPISR